MSTWTREKPTAIGWYWLRYNLEADHDPHTPELVRVSACNRQHQGNRQHLLVDRVGIADSVPLECFLARRHEWWGPVPVEPPP
jgi:hypothetical protein